MQRRKRRRTTQHITGQTRDAYTPRKVLSNPFLSPPPPTYCCSTQNATQHKKPCMHTSYVLSSNPFLSPPTHCSSWTLLNASPCVLDLPPVDFLPVLPPPPPPLASSPPPPSPLPRFQEAHAHMHTSERDEVELVGYRSCLVRLTGTEGRYRRQRTVSIFSRPQMPLRPVFGILPVVLSRCSCSEGARLSKPQLPVLKQAQHKIPVS